MSNSNHKFRSNSSLAHPREQGHGRSFSHGPLAAFPRAAIAHTPTPFERLERLSERLGGPNIWIKRDDCTGLAGGGNKARKLEFLIGAALAAKADTLITAGAIQSNHARQTAAAAARFNMRCILVLTKPVPGLGSAYDHNGNILIDRILGAEIHLAEAGAESAPVMEEIAARERGAGRRPFIIPVGGSNAVGTLGYVDGFFELSSQFEASGTAFDYIILPTGSGGTQAGLLLGAALLDWRGKILGVSVGSAAGHQSAKVKHVLLEASSLLDVKDRGFEEEAALINDRSIGPGYGQPAPGTIEAIRIAAETEGLLLDPVYSGKAMAALIAMARSGQLQPGQNVAFLHTGGSQALSAYPEYFQ